MSYRDALETCGTLTEGLSGDNPEYERGQLELIGDLFGRPQIELGERVIEIERDVRTLWEMER